MTGSSVIAEDQREGQQEILEQRSAAVIAGIEAIDPDHVLHLASSTLKIVLSHFLDGPGARPGRRVFAMPREEEGVAIAAGLELAGARPVLIFQDNGIGNQLTGLVRVRRAYHLPLLAIVVETRRPGRVQLVDPHHQRADREHYSMQPVPAGFSSTPALRSIAGPRRSSEHGPSRGPPTDRSSYS